MKIAFWSNIHGQTGTTSNLIAIAIMGTLHYHHKNMLIQTHYNLNNLEASLLPSYHLKEKDFFMDVGIDALVKSIKSFHLDGEIIESCLVSLLDKHLNLLPGTTKINKDIYEYELKKTIIGILHEAERYYDLIYIDTNSGRNELTMKILQNSDLIVVNLNQNKTILDDFDINYKFNDKKVFYLIGNYNSNSSYNLKNMKRSYGFLKDNNTAVIPYNTEYMDALSDGQAVMYMLKNMNCNKEDSNSYFIKEVTQALEKIIKFSGMERRNKVGIHS